MFTGIIQGRGTLTGTRPSGSGLAFELEAGFDLEEPVEGESISVNGACLTAYGIKGRRFNADVSPETLARTTLGGLQGGDVVNMERALRLSDRLGGHLVAGHVDCVARTASIRKEGSFTILEFALPEEQDRYVIEKGSIAIDGISLTVNSSFKGGLTVSIIPHTMQLTTLAGLRVGSKVNIEVDLIGKYVEKLVGGYAPETRHASRLTQSFLAEKGFY